MLSMAQERYINLSRYLHKKISEASDPIRVAKWRHLLILNDKRLARDLHKEADLLKEDIIRTGNFLYGNGSEPLKVKNTKKKQV